MKTYLVTGRGSKNQKMWKQFHCLPDAQKFADECNWRDVEVFGGKKVSSEEPKPTKSKELSKRGVDAAARYLERKGYTIIEYSYSCSAGKVDLIAEDDNGTLVFIDCQTCTDLKKGFPKVLVDDEQRDRFERIALHYLAEDDEYVNTPVRYDVVCLTVCDSSRAMIRHHINAINESL